MDARTTPCRKRTSEPASSISARRSVSTASRPVKWSSSATSAARARVASGPSTAAASASARAPGVSRSRRRAVARPTDSEPSPTRRAGSDWPSSPAARALASSAFTRKGTPPDSAPSASRKPSDASRKPSAWAIDANPVRRQRREALHPRERHRLEAVRQVGVGARLAAGARADDHHGQLLQALRQVQQQLERGPVDPLEVVHGDQRHAPLGESPDEAPHAVERRVG